MSREQSVIGWTLTRLVYPAAGAVCGFGFSFGLGNLAPLVLFLILIGIFLSRAVVTMARARWSPLMVFEADWAAFCIALVIGFTGGVFALSAIMPWFWMWIGGALFAFWMTFVARAVET